MTGGRRTRAWAAPLLATVVVVAAAVVVVAGAAPAGAVGPTTWEGGDFVSGPEGGAPAIATNGPRTLVVFEVPGATAGTTAVRGVILTSGTDEVVAEVTVASGATRSYGLPDLAWNGTHWLVVFEARTVANGDRTIASRRVTASGGLVGDVVTLGSSSGHDYRPAVAAGTNGQWAVAWETTMAQSSTGYDVRLGRVTSGGVALDGPTGKRASLDVAGTPRSDRAPDVAWGAGRYLVVWQSDGGEHMRSVAAAGFRANGTYAGAGYPMTVDASPLEAPSVASNGTRFLIAVTSTFGSSSDIEGVDVRIGSDDFFHSTFTTISSMPGDQTDPTVTWNGSYLVAWRDTRDDPAGDIYAAHLPTSTTDPLDSDSFFLNVTEGNTSPAVTGGAAAHRFMDAYSITGWGVFSEGMRFPAPK